MTGDIFVSECVSRGGGRRASFTPPVRIVFGGRGDGSVLFSGADFYALPALPSPLTCTALSQPRGRRSADSPGIIVHSARAFIPFPGIAVAGDRSLETGTVPGNRGRLVTLP